MFNLGWFCSYGGNSTLDIDAQSHLNKIIASYHRDMNVLRTCFMSSHYGTNEEQPSSWHEDVNDVMHPSI